MKKEEKRSTTYAFLVSERFLSVTLTSLLLSTSSSPAAGVTGSYQPVAFTEA